MKTQLLHAFRVLTISVGLASSARAADVAEKTKPVPPPAPASLQVDLAFGASPYLGFGALAAHEHGPLVELVELQGGASLGGGVAAKSALGFGYHHLSKSLSIDALPVGGWLLGKGLGVERHCGSLGGPCNPGMNVSSPFVGARLRISQRKPSLLRGALLGVDYALRDYHQAYERCANGVSTTEMACETRVAEVTRVLVTVEIAFVLFGHN